MFISSKKKKNIYKKKIFENIMLEKKKKNKSKYLNPIGLNANSRREWLACRMQNDTCCTRVVCAPHDFQG